MENNITDLLNSAQDDGSLSQAAVAALTNVEDFGATIQQALGTPADQITSSEVVLVSGVIDDTGSIQYAGCTQAVIDGYNLIITSLRASKQSGDVLVTATLFNNGLLHPYVSLSQAVLLDSNNYRPNGGTPLYDRTLEGCGLVAVKTQEFSDQGIPVRSVTVIVTDGEDNQSRARIQEVKPVIRDMLRTENHIVAAMGIGQGKAQQDAFRNIFREMGIEDQWILTPSSDPSEVRKAFAVVSQSAVRVSQNAAAFKSQTAGGFGAP